MALKLYEFGNRLSDYVSQGRRVGAMRHFCVETQHFQHFFPFFFSFPFWRRLKRRGCSAVLLLKDHCCIAIMYWQGQCWTYVTFCFCGFCLNSHKMLHLIEILGLPAEADECQYWPDNKMQIKIVCSANKRITSTSTVCYSKKKERESEAYAVCSTTHASTILLFTVWIWSFAFIQFFHAFTDFHFPKVGSITNVALYFPHSMCVSAEVHLLLSVACLVTLLNFKFRDAKYKMGRDTDKLYAMR